MKVREWRREEGAKGNQDMVKKRETLACRRHRSFLVLGADQDESIWGNYE